MLVAVAGSIGAGKSTVAQAIAAGLDIPLLSIDDDKRALGATTPGFDRWVAEGIPFPDDFRAKAFDRTLARLRRLAGGSAHAVVEETFHRKALRDRLFDEGAALMGGLFVVEVRADAATIEHRLRGRAGTEADHLAGMDMYRSFLAASDPQDRVDHVFHNDTGFDEELERCLNQLRVRLDAGGSVGPT